MKETRASFQRVYLLALSTACTEAKLSELVLQVPVVILVHEVSRLVKAMPRERGVTKSIRIPIGTKRLPPLALTSLTPPLLLHGNMVSPSHALCGRYCQAPQFTRILLRKILRPFFCLTPTIAVERPGILVFLGVAYKWLWPEFSKIHIFETKANLHRRRDTCLMDFKKFLFYHGPIAICILELRPPPSQCLKYCHKLGSRC